MKITEHAKYKEACLQADQDLPGYLPALQAVKQQGCYWAWFYSYKLTELHDWCLANQPRMILELGSGLTTFVMARYAGEFRSRLVTVEENAAWRDEDVMKRMPEWARVQWWMSQTVIEGDTIRYQALPTELPEIDLLYVDGPAMDGKGKSLAGSDAALLIESGVKVKSILVDIRTATVDLIRDRMVDLYGFEPGGTYPWTKPWYLRPMRHHSWFWRK